MVFCFVSVEIVACAHVFCCVFAGVLCVVLWVGVAVCWCGVCRLAAIISVAKSAMMVMPITQLIQSSVVCGPMVSACIVSVIVCLLGFVFVYVVIFWLFRVLSLLFACCLMSLISCRNSFFHFFAVFR